MLKFNYRLKVNCIKEDLKNRVKETPSSDIQEFHMMALIDAILLVCEIMIENSK